jgi:hypothetical protein
MIPSSTREIYVDIAKNEKDLQIHMEVAEKLLNTSLTQEVYADIVKIGNILRTDLRYIIQKAVL